MTRRTSKLSRRQALNLSLSLPLALEEGWPPKLFNYLIFLGGLIVFAFVAWAAVTEVDEVTLSEGQVMPAGSVRSVQHLEGGLVEDIMVRDGQLVEAGDILISLEPTAAKADLLQLQARKAALSLEAERLRAFVEDRESDFATFSDDRQMIEDQARILELQRAARDRQLEVLRTRIEQRRAELASLLEQRLSLEKQRDILAEQVEMRRELESRGLVSRVIYLETERAFSQTAAQLAELLGEVAGTQEALNEAEISLSELTARVNSEALQRMGTVSAELAEVVNSLAKLEDRVERLEIRAPVRGLVKGLAVRTVGGVIVPGETVAEIVPVNDELVAEVNVAPRDVGHIRVGQEAKVTVTTYDPTQYGYITGRVRQVSPSTFQNEQGELFYKSVVALEQSYLEQNGKAHAILPGMVVKADIITGKRTLAQYLLKPIRRTFDQSFAER